jgi:hypothetical protein
MDVDPKDDCTFWYTTEYYESTSTAGWRTRVSSFRNPECGKPREEKLAYEYAAKLICGLQKDPNVMRLVRGFYGSAINVHNPNDEPVVFRKKLALTFPPDEKRPGKIYPIARHKLGPDEALEVDCDGVRREVFDGQLPEPYIKGFIVVQSSDPVDVTAVYTAARLNKKDRAVSVTGIDVVDVIGRKKGPEKPELCPDLTIRDIGRPAVRCPEGPGSCVTKVDVTIANVGAGPAGAFDVRTILDPGQSVVVDTPVGGGLAAGDTRTLGISTPPGGNCFDPDCMITAIVDSRDSVRECDETNNRKSETTLG